MASTLKVDKLEGSTGSTIEVTSGQTLKATAPIVATSILDTNSNELVKLTATGSATNELTVANAATGSGPTLSSTGSSDSNININITPAGTGDVVLKTDLVSLGGGSETGHLSSNGAYDLKLDTNSSTNSGSIVITDGANEDIDITPNGTGDVNLGADTVQVGDNDANATITTQGTGDLILNTNNGTNAGTITLADGAGGDITLTPDGVGIVKATDAADATAAVQIAGKETLWVPATAMYATTTNGAEANQAELTATTPELKTFMFDTTTAEYVQFNVSFPKRWDEGTVTFQTMWSASSTDTGTGGFKLQGVSIANNVDYDTAFGTAVANTALAASGTQDDLMINVESGDVTIASAAVDTNTVFQIVRDVAADTNTGDLRLVGCKIFYTTDAANDA